MNYTKEELHKLHQLLFKLLLEVDRICKKYDIPYFLIGGSLLGAVRHHGFIPWDDDIDIGMLRENYEKFIDICRYELKSEYFLQTKESDSYYYLSWAKLQLNGTKMMGSSKIKTNMRCGINIDIFPFDNTSKYLIGRYLHSNIGFMLRGIYGVKCGHTIQYRGKSLKKMIGGAICRSLAIIVSKNTTSRMMDAHIQYYNKRETPHIMNLAGVYNKETFTRDVMENLINLDFEGYQVPVPREYHLYLVQFYGDDYMELPPEEGRIQHDVVELDFGDYA